MYVALRVTPFAHRLFATNCAESYHRWPSLRSNIVKQLLVGLLAGVHPLNSGNGRLNSNRDNVALVKRVVPSKPGTLKNGFVSS